MATLEEFKALRDGVPAEVQAELYKLMTADPDASIRRMVEIAAEKADGHLRQPRCVASCRKMDDDDEFDDIELNGCPRA